MSHYNVSCLASVLRAVLIDELEYSLNVCAANFSTSRPSQNIAAALAASRRPKKREEVDLTLLPSDDPDPGGVGLPTSDGSAPIVIEDLEEDEILEEGEETKPSVDTGQPVHHIELDSEEEDEEDDIAFVKEDRPAFTTCKVCGSRLFSFSAAAHKAFHENDGAPLPTSTSKSSSKKRKARDAKVSTSSSSGSSKRANTVTLGRAK